MKIFIELNMQLNDNPLKLAVEIIPFGSFNNFFLILLFVMNMYFFIYRQKKIDQTEELTSQDKILPLQNIWMLHGE